MNPDDLWIEPARRWRIRRVRPGRWAIFREFPPPLSVLGPLPSLWLPVSVHRSGADALAAYARETQ